MTAATATELDQTITDYLSAVDQNATYPEAGFGSLRSVAYSVCGLVSEAAEVLEKVVDPTEGLGPVQDELGDVAQYVVATYREMDADPQPVLRAAVLGIRDVDSPGNGGLLAAVDSVAWIVGSAGRVASLFNDALRDDAGEVSGERRERMLAELSALIDHWVFVHLALDLDCESTLRVHAARREAATP